MYYTDMTSVEDWLGVGCVLVEGLNITFWISKRIGRVRLHVTDQW